MMATLLHDGATVQCIHGGQARPITTDQRVSVGNQKVVTQSSPYSVSGCSNPVNMGGPCVSAQFVTAATRVRASGQPVLLKDSNAICSPTGTLTILVTQTRATGS